MKGTDIDPIDRTTHTIVPAAPGWFVAVFNDHSYERSFFDCHPIVARDVHHGMFLDGSRGWAPYRNAAPVVPCDLVDATDDIMRGFGKDWALKSPDGKYRVVGEEGNEVLDNEDDALAWFSDVRAAESAATSSPTPPPAA